MALTQPRRSRRSSARYGECRRGYQQDVGSAQVHLAGADNDMIYIVPLTVVSAIFIPSLLKGRCVGAAGISCLTISIGIFASSGDGNNRVNESTIVIYGNTLLGIHGVAAFLQLELFRVYNYFKMSLDYQRKCIIPPESQFQVAYERAYISYRNSCG